MTEAEMLAEIESLRRQVQVLTAAVRERVSEPEPEDA